MRKPGPLPQPLQYYDRRWADRLIATLERFFSSLAGDLEVQSRLITRAGRRRKVTLVTDSTYTVLKTDDIVDVNRAGAVTLTLPATPEEGACWKIHDSSGDASSNNITVMPSAGYNINGAASVGISTNYGAMFIYFNGTQFIAE